MITKMKVQPETISTLNNLIASCNDGMEGYSAAARGIRNADLKTLFKTYARQRAQFADELQGEVERLGCHRDQIGQAGDGYHRGWKSRSGLSKKEEEEVISEIERGESSAIMNYEDALEADLPMDVRGMVERQYFHIKESHDLIRALGKAFR